MSTPMNFKLGEYTVGKFDNANSQHLAHKQGTIYLATNDLFSAHMIYDDGTNFLDIIPRMIPVAYGGTGNAKLSKGGILVGNDEAKIEVISSNDAGKILVSNGVGVMPIYAIPGMKWTDGTGAGPRFHYIINGVDIEGQTIPAASETTSGIITTYNGQKIAGKKTFLAATYAAHIYPKDENTYNLGHWSGTTNNRVWDTLHIETIKLYDTKKYAVTIHTKSNPGEKCTTEGIYGTQGYVDFHLGNAIARSTTLNEGKGNSKGRMYLYGSSSGYILLDSSNNSTNNYHIKFPGVNGTAVISAGEYSNKEAKDKRIPFFSNGSYNSVEHSNDFLFTHTNVDNTSTIPGISRLTLGNSTSVGDEKNQRGSLRLYTAGTSYIDIEPDTEYDATSDTLTIVFSH